MKPTQVKRDKAYHQRQLARGNKRITIVVPIKDHAAARAWAAARREARKDEA